jgi:hypothetical protein
MKKQIGSITVLAAFALGGCSSSPVVLTPAGSTPTNVPTTPPATAQYVQIERLSRPAIKEVFEPFQAHQVSNAIEPYADTTIQGDIKGTEDALRPPKAVNGTTVDYGAALAGVLYPDEYSVNLAGNAPQAGDADPYYFLSNELNSARFGGRAPNDDVIYLELGALFGGILPAVGLIADDNQEDNCLSGQNIGGQGKPGGQDPSKLTTATFPYLPVPHSASSTSVVRKRMNLKGSTTIKRVTTTSIIRR